MASAIHDFSFNDKDYNYSKIRILDLSQQILNSRINIFEEYENFDDLFKIYSKVLKNHINSSTQNSLNNSRESYLDNDLQKFFTIKLKSNEPDSFLVVPIMASGHMFAGVIRKYDDLFSLTVVNTHSNHVEYLFNENDLVPILDTILNANLPISKIYPQLKLKSLEHHNLSIESREQKIGNCFIKEPENTIKYAIATSNYDINSLKKLRDSTAINKIKWPLSTNETHIRFINELIKEYPQLKKELTNELNIYVSNKNYRKYLKEGYANETAFLKAFSPVSIEQANTPKDITPEYIKELLKKLNSDTLHQNSKQIKELIEKTNDPEYIKKFNELYKLNSLSEFYSSMPKVLENIHNIFNLLGFRKTSLKDRFINGIKLNEESFPYITSKLKYDIHIGLASSTNLCSLIFRPTKLLKRLNESISLVPHDPNLYLLRAVVHMAQRDE